MVAKRRNKHPENKGEKHGMTKLTKENVLKIREYAALGTLTQDEIGDMFNISRHSVSLIHRRLRWRHI
jgi:DNA-directed RNA polymerase specialized sigma subunit